jgi:hypothetical protein
MPAHGNGENLAIAEALGAAFGLPVESIAPKDRAIAWSGVIS